MSRRVLAFAALAVGLVGALSPGAGARAPTQDSVLLTGGPAEANQETVFVLDATSGPSGEAPTGQVRFDAVSGSFQLGGPVTCLAVSANTATLNFLDQLGTAPFGITTVHVIDNGPPGLIDVDVFDAIPTGRAPT